MKDIEIGDHAGVKVGALLSTQHDVAGMQADALRTQWLNSSCLSCDFCQQMDEPLCPKATMSGYTVDGTFQQYCIAKAAHVARIPKDVPLDAISPILCAGITVYKGLKESGARPGQTVAIVGAGGGLGSLAQQYAKAMGLRVIAVDAGDEKKKMCEEMGATAFVDFSKSSDVVKDVQAATEDGLGPHAVLLVAVNEKPFQQASEVRFSSRRYCQARVLTLRSTSDLTARLSSSVCLPALTSALLSSRLLSEWLPSRDHTSETARTRSRPSTSSGAALSRRRSRLLG